PGFGTAAGWLAHRSEVDSLVATWARDRFSSDVETTLLAAGVPVSRVNTLREAVNDPSLGLEQRFAQVASPSGHAFPMFMAPISFAHCSVSIRRGIPE